MAGGRTGEETRMVGTWSLAAIQVELDDTGERIDLYGPNPVGRLVLTENGRMMTIISAGDRAPPQDDADGGALFESMMAYSGAYRVESGDAFITEVDLAWHPAWIGTEQKRFYRFDGDNLIIRTDVQTHPKIPGKMGYGLLTWTRE